MDLPIMGKEQNSWQATKRNTASLPEVCGANISVSVEDHTRLPSRPDVHTYHYTITIPTHRGWGRCEKLRILKMRESCFQIFNTKIMKLHWNIRRTVSTESYTKGSVKLVRGKTIISKRHQTKQKKNSREAIRL